MKYLTCFIQIPKKARGILLKIVDGMALPILNVTEMKNKMWNLKSTYCQEKKNQKSKLSGVVYSVQYTNSFIIGVTAR